jgi:glutamate carboxypeptidase
VDSLLAYARAKQKNIIALIRQLVECESPSDDSRALTRFVSLMEDVVAPMAKIRLFPHGHMRAELLLPGAKKSGQILALGHSDTVWPMGTLRSMPFRQEKGRLWGPGVLDMKSGLAFFVFAMRALRELDIPVSKKVVLQINSDEEVGSGTSRALTEEAAGRSDCVLVLEPGTGLAGKLKTARKGVGVYRVSVRGRASHAGVDFEAGASAIVELARQIERIGGFTDLKRGVTVNPGVISGGTRSNVVAAEAQAEIDMRVARLQDASGLDRKFSALRPFDKRCAIEVTGGMNRPPMERSRGIRELFGRARRLAREIGVEVEESSTGGGSDGNFTAALGVPTLDGLGGVGEGAHAANESILVDRIADRTALLAKLIVSASGSEKDTPAR